MQFIKFLYGNEDALMACIIPIFGKRNVAQQRLPIDLDSFGSALLASECMWRGNCKLRFTES